MDIPEVGDLVLDVGLNGWDNHQYLILEVVKTEKFVNEHNRIFRIRALSLKSNVYFEIEITPMRLISQWHLLQRVLG